LSAACAAGRFGLINIRKICDCNISIQFGSAGLEICIYKARFFIQRLAQSREFIPAKKKQRKNVKLIKEMFVSGKAHKNT